MHRRSIFSNAFGRGKTMTISKFRSCLWGLVLVLLTAMPWGTAFGQAVFGSISGTVTDPTAASVAKARVTITDTGKGVSYATTTNDSGNYSQQHLIVGTYEVRVEAAGFQTWVQRN